MDERESNQILKSISKSGYSLAVCDCDYAPSAFSFYLSQHNNNRRANSIMSWSAKVLDLL